MPYELRNWEGHMGCLFDFEGLCEACGTHFHALVAARSGADVDGCWCIVCGAALTVPQPGIELSEGDRRTSDRIIAEALGWSL